MSFGYADKPEKGIFNPARSLFATDSSLYGSLYATKIRPGDAWDPDALAKPAKASGLGDYGSGDTGTHKPFMTEGDKAAFIEKYPKLKGALLAAPFSHIFECDGKLVSPRLGKAKCEVGPDAGIEIGDGSKEVWVDGSLHFIPGPDCCPKWPYILGGVAALAAIGGAVYFFMLRS